MAQNYWSREELIVAFNLYLKLPFGKMHSNQPDVKKLATLIGRTNNSIALRLVNFASMDPYHQERGVKGMANAGNNVKKIWDEFIVDRETLLFESEKILSKLENRELEDKFKIGEAKFLVGKDKERLVKTRVNQSVFRQLILGYYGSKCAITGMDIPELLFASHIIPWSKNEKERLNPSNGICLSATYDVAFDKGLIGIKPDHTVALSKRILGFQTRGYFDQYFRSLNGVKIQLPERYAPKKDFLEWHMEEVFNRN